MTTIMLKLNYEHRRIGDRYAVRVVQLPIYTYVEDWADLDRQLDDALRLFRSGFPDKDAFLEYLRANNVEPIIDELGLLQVQPPVWTRASDEREYAVALA